MSSQSSDEFRDQFGDERDIKHEYEYEDYDEEDEDYEEEDDVRRNPN